MAASMGGNGPQKAPRGPYETLSAILNSLGAILDALWNDDTLDAKRQFDMIRTGMQNVSVGLSIVKKLSAKARKDQIIVSKTDAVAIAELERLFNLESDDEPDQQHEEEE